MSQRRMPRSANPARPVRVPTRSGRAAAVMIGVAAGAGVAGLASQPHAAGPQRSFHVDLLAGHSGQARAGMGGAAEVHRGAPAPVLPPPSRERSPREEVAQLQQSERVTSDRLARERAEQQRRERQQRRAAREAARDRVVAPVQGGQITSNYGSRWGGTHYGLDIANPLGTPIVAPKAGVVVEAGPASGFGLWVRIQHPDGTITVYGHISSYAVQAGQQVQAGQLIARVGNRGQSSGPHLHFEVWDPSGKKINPLAWLQSSGVWLN